MNIPDSWPPEGTEASSTARTAPMFPLPGVFLFPRELLPLRVFEPRYIEMIEDSLDGPGRIVIGTVLEQDRADLPGAPPVLPIAGMGEIARHDRADDGLFYIWLAGVGRVRIDESESDRAYRQVTYEPLEERRPGDEDDSELRPQILEAIEERNKEAVDVVDEMDLSGLADLLAQFVRAPEPVMADLHGELDVAERARKALSAHERFPRSS